MHPAKRQKRVALRDWMFLLTALIISMVGIATYAFFTLIEPSPQQEVRNDRTQYPLPAGPHNDPKQPTAR